MLTRISDVGKMLNEPVTVLRHWQLNLCIPVLRTKAGQRFYTPRSIARFRLAKQLIRKEGYTLKGARARMRELEDWR